MNKLQARLYFLYPVLLGIFVLLYSTIFIDSTGLLHIYQWEFFVGTILTAGIVSFFTNKKTETNNVGLWAIVLLIASLIIIWGFVLFTLPMITPNFTHTRFPATFLGFVGVTTVSGMLFFVLSLIFYLIRSFFEWMFKETQDNKKSDYVEAE